MARRRPHRPLAALLVPTIGTAMLAYFAVHAIQGDRGLLAKERLLTEIAAAETTLAALRSERSEIEHLANGLGPYGLDLDLLDERARAMLNMARPDEVVVFLDRNGTPLGNGLQTIVHR